MNTDCMDPEREAAAFFLELKTEVDACQRHVVALTDELHAQREGFAAYKARTEAQLSELREHNTTLGCEFLALRMKASEAGNGPKKPAATHHPDRGAEDRRASLDGIRSAARLSITSETAEDIKIRSFRNIAAALDGMRPKTEDPNIGAARVSVRSEAAEKMGAARISVGSKLAEDETIGSSRSIVEEYAAMKMEDPMCDAWPRKPDPVPKRTGRITSRVSVTSKASVDEEIRILRKIAAGCDAAMKMEEPTGDAWPRKPDPAPERAGPTALVSGDSTDSAKDRVMRRRIFLLRHASRCTAPEGTCRTRNCAETKAVYNHIIEDGCTDPDCGVRHCVSSRYAMRNYQPLSYQPLSRGAVCHAAVKRSEST